ncbi:hypothetical protein J4232_05670 [Candidatus Woesearchaeota archaeon]|nr:hypothetical protein [Candidatus Woesearchaeota archaeon]
MLDKFERYVELGKVKKKTPDSEEASSLFKKAEKRLKYIRVLNEDTADLVFEDAYEATREAARKCSLFSQQFVEKIREIMKEKK